MIDIVTKLKQWSLSAGNPLFKGGTSETLRNEIVSDTENVKDISVHNSKHLKPISDNQFGHYLAGLIDGDGHFSSAQQLVIVFSGSDVSLAYFIKKRLGFGNVRKVKDKNDCLLIVSNTEGLTKVINLINGKLRTSKYNQVLNNILIHPRYYNLKQSINFKINSTNDFNNHWIAGLSDANASFQIKVVPKATKSEIGLNYQIDQKNKDILNLIKDYFGGNVSYKLKDEYSYSSDTYGSARKIIKYFDKYHLQSTKYINYLKWRKAYVLIQKRLHLTEQGINQLIRLKDSMKYNLR